jgi:four helix bundle protein
VKWCAALIQSEAVGLSRGRELDRHVTGLVLNVAEGNGTFSVADRRRFLDIALAAGLQAAASLDLLMARGCIAEDAARQGKNHLGEIVSMIGAMSRSLS